MARRAHPTKSGPGRQHKDGLAHPAPPVPPRGAPSGFVQLTASAARRAKRALVKAFGIRQVKRMARTAAP